MRKFLIAIMVAVMLVGCSSKNEPGSLTVSKAEYSYSDLQEMRDIFVDEWLKETDKLSKAEYYGTSNDEEESNEHYFKISADYAKKVAENHKDIPIGEKVIVTGYISNVHEHDSDSFFVRKGTGSITFQLKHNASDSEYDGFSCRTYDNSFLEIKDNTTIKIEAVLLKPEMFGSNNDLYDCKILEIGETENVEPETLMTSVPSLEETEESKMQAEVLAKETYYIGEDEFSFSLFQESGEFKTSLFCNIENKSNVFDTYFFLNSFLNSKEKDVMTMADVLNLTYTIFAGDGSFIMQNKDMLYLSSSEKEIMSADDYFSQDWLTNEYQKGDYGTQIADFLVDFIENN